MNHKHTDLIGAIVCALILAATFWLAWVIF